MNTHATPVLIRDVKRGQVRPDQRTIRALEAKIDNDPRWAADDPAVE